MATAVIAASILANCTCARRAGLIRRVRGDLLSALLRFFFSLLVGRALACGSFVEGAPLRRHPHAGVAGERSARDVPGDPHDHLVACARPIADMVLAFRLRAPPAT